MHPHHACSEWCVRACVEGLLLNLKFHNICSIGSAIHTSEKDGAFMGRRCNWGGGGEVGGRRVCVCGVIRGGLVCAFYVHVSEHVCRLCMHWWCGRQDKIGMVTRTRIKTRNQFFIVPVPETVH